MNRLVGRFSRATTLLVHWWRERADRAVCVEIASLIALCCVIGGVIGGVNGPHWLVGLVLGAVGGLVLLGLARLGGTMLARRMDGKSAIPPLPTATRKRIGSALRRLFDGARGEGLILIILCTIAGGIGGAMTFGVLIGAGIGFAMSAIIVGWIGLIYLLFGR